jgi:hypothetical protein
MANPVPVPALVAVQVTLPDTSPHQLYALMLAVEPALAGVLQNVKSLRIQCDLNNGGNNLLVGDSSISLTRFGERLLAHDQESYTSPVAIEVPLKAYWVLAEIGTPCLANVEVIT